MAFQAAAAADFLVIVFEAAYGIKRQERALFDELRALGKPFVVVLNKMDLVANRDQQAVLEAAARNLEIEPLRIIPTVATDGTNIARIVVAIAELEPGLLAALADAMPHYRARLAWARITPAAAAAATVALFPLPLADIIPLLAIQTGMVLTIARIYGYEITASRAKELIAAFGLGFLARTLYRELAKFLGLPGWLLSAGIAASATVAMGYAAMVWFESGEWPSRATLQKVMRDVTLYLRDRLASLGAGRPDQGTLRERVQAALNDLPSHLPLLSRPSPASEPSGSVTPHGMQPTSPV